MTEQQLTKLGFKKKTFSDSYWFEFELKGGHTFLTNDLFGMRKKGEWYIGYQFKNDDTFWFNERLNDEGIFKIVFHLLIGKDFKLAHQRKLII